MASLLASLGNFAGVLIILWMIGAGTIARAITAPDKEKEELMNFADKMVNFFFMVVVYIVVFFAPLFILNLILS